MLRATTMRETLFHLERSQPATLQAQIREVLMGAITAGRLKPGEPVPSTRTMAAQLGVSRNTVTLAYQALVAEGFLTARERSGYFVDPDAVDGLAPGPRPQAVAEARRGGIDWRARIAGRPSEQRLVPRPADWQRYPYPFVYGQVDAQVFPIAEWRDCVRQAMGRRWLDAWTLDRYSEDDPLLTEEIARRILPRRGIAASPAQVLVTLGAQNALYLVAALLIGRGTRTVMEEPGYPDLRYMLGRQTRHLGHAPVDRDGMVVDAAISGPLDGAEIVFCTPSHHYPTTVTMSLERRHALLRAARRQGAVIVEDDYEFEANYIGSPLPALKSLDEDGRVIYVGSFSKSLMPGLRLGFIVAEEALIDELRALRRLMLRHPPGNNQRAAALFLANGHFDVLVRRIHRVYRERWQVMAEALEDHLPGWAQSPGFGGSSYWLTGPEGFDAAAFGERARAEGVVIEAGEPFFACSDAGRRHCRLGFSSIPSDRIAAGIARLAGLIEPR